MPNFKLKTTLHIALLTSLIVLTGCPKTEEAILEERQQEQQAQQNLNEEVTPVVTPQADDVSAETIEQTKESENNELTKVEETQSFPDKKIIKIPFYAQAPYGDWSMPWQETCEEASITLVANHYQDLDLSKSEFRDRLQSLVDWQLARYGAYEHTDVAQTVEMLKANFNLEAVVHEEPDFATIQAIINKGHLIIAPFAGQLLGNPNFSGEGPVYHMSVIVGYDAKKQIVYVHDVGTRNGKNYEYSWQTINTALHDYNDEILKGTKQFIEVVAP